MFGKRIMVFASILLLTGLAGTARATLIFFDDFNGGNDNGWVRYQPLAPFGAAGTYTFPSGGYRTQAPTSPLPAVLGPGRAGSSRLDVNLTNFQLSVDLVAWNNNLDQGFGLVARTREIGLGTSDGYFLHYNPLDPGIVIDRLDDEIPTQLGGDFVALDPAQDYRLVFTGVGSRLTGQVFSLSNLSTALVTSTVTDSTYSSGAVGLLVSGLLDVSNGPADATFDNFRVDSVPEPGSLMLLAMGVIGMFSYGWRRKQAKSAAVPAYDETKVERAIGS